MFPGTALPLKVNDDKSFILVRLDTNIKLAASWGLIDEGIKHGVLASTPRRESAKDVLAWLSVDSPPAGGGEFPSRYSWWGGRKYITGPG